MRHPDGLEGYAPEPDPAEDDTKPEDPPLDPRWPYGPAFGRWVGWGR